MCYIKQSAWKKALFSCDEALARRPENPKAHFRRAVVQEELKDYDAALLSVKAGLALSPEDQAFATLKARVEGKQAKEKAKQKQMYAKMFG
jgi:regulator of sirC expression with transglutaminase-like and TPR domain